MLILEVLLGWPNFLTPAIFEAIPLQNKENEPSIQKKGCNFFCLQLEASCLQWSFSTYSCVWDHSIWSIWVHCAQMLLSLRKNGEEESRLLQLRLLGSFAEM